MHLCALLYLSLERRHSIKMNMNSVVERSKAKALKLLVTGLPLSQVGFPWKINMQEV